MNSEGRGKKKEQDLRCVPFIFTLSVLVKCAARRTLLITSGLTKLAHGEGALAPSPINLSSPGH